MILCAIGTTEIILIAVVILLLFGGKKIPELMRGLGIGVSQFKKGLREADSNLNGQNEQDVKDSEYEAYQRREEIKKRIIKEKEAEMASSSIEEKATEQ